MEKVVLFPRLRQVTGLALMDWDFSLTVCMVVGYVALLPWGISPIKCRKKTLGAFFEQCFEGCFILYFSLELPPIV